MLVNPQNHRRFVFDIWKLCLPFCSFEDSCAVVCMSKIFYTNLDHADFWDIWFTENIERILNQFPGNICFGPDVRYGVDGMLIKGFWCSRLDSLKGQWKEKAKFIDSFPLNRIVYSFHWWVIVIPEEHAKFQRFLFQIISLNNSFPLLCTETDSYKLTIPLPLHRQMKLSLKFHSKSGLFHHVFHRDHSLHSWSIEFPPKSFLSLSTLLIISKNNGTINNNDKNQNYNSERLKGKIEGAEYLEDLLIDLGFNEKEYFFPFLFFLLTYGHVVYADLSSAVDFFFCEAVLPFKSKWWKPWASKLVIRYGL